MSISAKITPTSESLSKQLDEFRVAQSERALQMTLPPE